MMHEISVTAYDNGDGGELVVDCSCGVDLLPMTSFTRTLSLDELAAIAHDHIEDTERGRTDRWARPDMSDSRAYRTTSVLTSEDQLIDIETGSFRRLTDESRGGDFTYG
jgi:hypothetical protein